MQPTKRAKNFRWVENPGSTEHLIEMLMRNDTNKQAELAVKLEKCFSGKVDELDREISGAKVIRRMEDGHQNRR